MSDKLSRFDVDPGRPPGDWLRRFQEAERHIDNPMEHGRALKKIFDDIRYYYRDFYRNIALELSHDEAMRVVLNEIQLLRIQISEIKLKGEA